MKRVLGKYTIPGPALRRRYPARNFSRPFRTTMFCEKPARFHRKTPLSVPILRQRKRIFRPTRYGRVRTADLIRDRAMVGQNERKACFGSNGYALLRSPAPPVHCPHQCSAAGERIKGNLLSDGGFPTSGRSISPENAGPVDNDGILSPSIICPPDPEPAW
jgi:hypothetical protein